MEIKTEPKVKIDCKQGLIRAIRFNADGHYGLTCGSDRTIKLWRPSKLLELKCYRGHSAEVTDCQSNPDSSQLLSCSNDKSIISWDVETGKLLKRFRNMFPFNSVCYGGHQSKCAVAASADGTVRIYDLLSVNAWEPIQSLNDSKEAITCCRVQDHFIYTTSLDKGLRCYDIRKGSLSIDSLHMQLYHLSVAAQSESLLLSVVRGNPVLYDPKTGKILNEYKGIENKLFKIESTFALNDSRVLAGSEDGRVYLWELGDSMPRLALEHKLETKTSFYGNSNLTVIQTLSSDTLDFLLTACNNCLFLWQL